MENTIEIPLHTIIFTIAPSNAGKTYFCQNILIPKIKERYSDLNVQYISSDMIRRELLADESKHKHDVEMLQVSEQAFNLFNTKLDMVMSYPISSEIVVLDTTGLSEVYRNDIIKKAKDNHYNIIPLVFDYNDREEYFKNVNDENTSKKVISDHILKLRKDVLKTLKKSKDKYTDIIKIRSLDFEKYNFEIKDYDFYKSHFITDNKNEYCVIGDIHGCYKEMKEMIFKCESQIDENDNIITDGKIFIVQDYVDKGYNTLKTIEFIYKNTLNGKILPLIGNHENYVYKKVTGQISGDHLHVSFFETADLLLKEENLVYKNMFIELFEKYSKHFYKHKNFFVNHAPCKTIYLGKVDSLSLKNQRNFRYSKFDENLSKEENFKIVENDLSFIKKQTCSNSKPIIWGHVAFDNTKQFDNIHMIDTGCVYKNKLSAISFEPKNGRYFYKTVSSKDNELLTEGVVLPIFKKNKLDKTYTLDILTPEQKSRVHHLFKNKVNFISGTVSPSDKNLDDYVLEDLSKGLDYYKNNGIDKVVLQPKYMGSRCNIYLNKDIEKTYCVTRNGYLVKIDYKEALTPLYSNNFIKKMFEENGAEIIVLDSELLPWGAIGNSLIEREFMSVKHGINSEYDLLKETGFEDNLNELLNNTKFNGFTKDLTELNKNQLIEKYGHHLYSTFKNVLEYNKQQLTLVDMEKYIQVYNRQMELFGKTSTVEFKPFSILKTINTNGSEITYFDSSNIDIFSLVSEDQYQVVDFTDEKYLEKAVTFYNEITLKQEMEGIVIKPNKVYNKDIAPYLKCRNENYLSIVYGYDYKKSNKYKKLIDRKRIKEKLKASIYEFELGKKMLEIPYNELVETNKTMESLYIQMILDEENVEKLDPRL